MLLITQPKAGALYNEILALRMTAEGEGWETELAPSGWRLAEELTQSGKSGVPYGSLGFCEVVADQMGWKLTGNPNDWLTRIHPVHLRRRVQFMPLGDALRVKETKFIKPAYDKCFLAQVYKPGELVVSEMIPRDTPTLVQDPVEFVQEYRCFVDGKQALTCSCYIKDGLINAQENWEDGSQKVMDHLNFLLKHEYVHSEAAVVDLGYLKTGELAIIESNEAWASGIYGCELSGVLKVLEGSCVPQSS